MLWGTLAQMGGFLLNEKQRTQNEYLLLSHSLGHSNTHQSSGAKLSFHKDQKKKDTYMESKTFIQYKHWQNEGR